MVKPFLAALVLIGAFAAPAQTSPWHDWRVTLSAESEHAGTIWDTSANTKITMRRLLERLSTARFVLLGEVHDNPAHHKLQGWIIARLASAGSAPKVVMEMISRDKAEALAEYQNRPDATAEGLGPALNWDKSGWPAWREYQPIAAAAFGFGLRILPGNPPSALVQTMAREGFEGLEAERKSELGLNKPFSLALAKALEDQLYEGHCELLARDKLAPMAKIQRLRDAFMADAMLLGSHEKAILIAGNGHVRKDRGVPWYLRRRAPQADIAVVMLVELDGMDDRPEDHIERGPDGTPIADYVLLTPRAERRDPCERMREMFQKRGRN